MDKKSILQKYMLSYSGKGECNPQEKSVTPSVVTQVVTPDEGYTCLSKVTVEAVTSAIDSNITAENIKKDVSILGVTGTLESGGSGDADAVLNSLIDKTITSIESNATSIGSSAFSNCSALASASFPNATSIGNSAFIDCTSLASATIPNATSIYTNAFQRCSSLTSIDTPKVTSIGESAFHSCEKLTSISLPKVKSISNYVFYNCRKLTSIDMPNATSIGNSAFQECSALASATIPNATSIYTNAFYKCTNLTSIDMPNVTSISTDAFAFCKKLTRVSMPKVTSIGGEAFWACETCLLFDFRGVTAVPTLSNVNAFGGGLPTDKKIVVPDALYDSWITATNWSSTTNNIVSSIIKASEYEASL